MFELNLDSDYELGVDMNSGGVGGLGVQVDYAYSGYNDMEFGDGVQVGDLEYVMMGYAWGWFLFLFKGILHGGVTPILFLFYFADSQYFVISHLQSQLLHWYSTDMM